MGQLTSVATAVAWMTGVQTIFSSDMVFAALKFDGSVVEWATREDYWGGYAMAPDLEDETIFSTGSAFAALKEDDSLVTWGRTDFGGIAIWTSPMWWTYSVPALPLQRSGPMAVPWRGVPTTAATPVAWI